MSLPLFTQIATSLLLSVAGALLGHYATQIAARYLPLGFRRGTARRLLVRSVRKGR